MKIPTYKDLFPEKIRKKIEEVAKKFSNKFPKADSDLDKIVDREEAEALQPDEDLE